MKHFSRYLFLTCLLCSLSLWQAHAVTPVFVVNGESYTHMAHVCMHHGDNSTITVSYNTGDDIIQDVTWQAIGDLKLLTHDASSATFESTNFGKGVVRLRYNSGICGSSIVDLHVYKEFDPEAHGLVIEGPDCLTPGETVVFSVRPVLTRNLNAYIGVDSYFWNLTDTGAAKPSFVDSIVYAAGDGSSVTFVAGTVHAGDEVRVNFGECNTGADKTVTKTLGKVPPRPILDRETLCIPYGNAPAEAVVVVNTTEGIEYTCSCPPQYAYVSDETADGKARFIFTADSISASEIKINATYRGEEACGSSEAIISVKRMWGDDVDLRYTGKGDCCATVGQPEEFSLAGTVPLYSGVHWDLPAGWERQGTTSSGFKIHIYPTNTAKGVDTLRVWGDACEDGIRKVVSTVVYVKPASVAAIEGPACVSIGVPDTFRVALNNDGSAPMAYRWTTSDGQNLTAYTGNYAVITPTANTTTISVQPLGLKCDAAVFTDTLAFMPVAPTGIISPSCIAYNMPDTVTFSINEPVANQQYAWTIPNGWRIVENRNNGREIDVRTTGVQGEYIVGAYSIGEGICGNSAVIYDTIRIDSIYTYLRYDSEGGSFTFMPRTIKNVHWYLLNNGQYVGDSEAFDPVDNRATEFQDPYYDLVGDIVNDPANCQTTTYSIVVEYITPDGCKGRHVQGRALSSNIDYHTLIASPAPQHAPRKESRVEQSSSTSLILSPNPANTVINASLDNGETFTLIIWNIDGEKVFQTNELMEIHSVDVTNLLKGNYIAVAVKDNKRVAYSKFIKQ